MYFSSSEAVTSHSTQPEKASPRSRLGVLDKPPLRNLSKSPERELRSIIGNGFVQNSIIAGTDSPFRVESPASRGPTMSYPSSPKRRAEEDSHILDGKVRMQRTNIEVDGYGEDIGKLYHPGQSAGPLGRYPTQVAPCPSSNELGPGNEAPSQTQQRKWMERTITTDTSAVVEKTADEAGDDPNRHAGNTSLQSLGDDKSSHILALSALASTKSSHYPFTPTLRSPSPSSTSSQSGRERFSPPKMSDRTGSPVTKSVTHTALPKREADEEDEAAAGAKRQKLETPSSNETDVPQNHKDTPSQDLEASGDEDENRAASKPQVTDMKSRQLKKPSKQSKRTRAKPKVIGKKSRKPKVVSSMTFYTRGTSDILPAKPRA